jgi:hypothetical protein
MSGGRLEPITPDRLRRTGEHSNDGGRTWSLDFDLIYERHAIPAEE